jgi:hypothetical protein
MKEGSFSYIKKTESSGPQDRLSKKIVSGQEMITSQDVEGYVDEIASVLKDTRDVNQTRTYILTVLSEESLIKHYLLSLVPAWKKVLALVSGKTRNEVAQGTSLHSLEPETLQLLKLELHRIQEAIKESLRKRLTNDQDLQHLDYSDILFTKEILTRNELVRRVETLNKKNHILKKEKRPYPSEIPYHQEALQLLGTLPEHPNILFHTHVDSERLETITEEIELRDESKETLLFRERLSLKEVLGVIKDCLQGAQFLEAHGIVLEDICPDNIGSHFVEGQRVGILFDIEGIYKANAPQLGRLSHLAFMPPEVSQDHPTIVSASEMVFQFGRSIELIINRLAIIDASIRAELDALIEGMTFYEEKAEYPTKKRLSLTTALDRLTIILQRIDTSSPEEDRLLAA